MPADYYLMLNIDPAATLPEIRQAFRELSKQVHPDRAGPEAEEKFIELQRAYETLRDPEKRAEYDRQKRQRDLRPAMDLFESFASHWPSREEISRVIEENFTQRSRSKFTAVHPVTIEVVLSTDEAASGGHIPLRIPVPEVCPICQGSGRTGFFTCDICGGAGSRWIEHQVDVLVPGGARDGMMIPVSLRHLGVRNMDVNCLVRVG